MQRYRRSKDLFWLGAVTVVKRFQEPHWHLQTPLEMKFAYLPSDAFSFTVLRPKRKSSHSGSSEGRGVTISPASSSFRKVAKSSAPPLRAFYSLSSEGSFFGKEAFDNRVILPRKMRGQIRRVAQIPNIAARSWLSSGRVNPRQHTEQQQPALSEQFARSYDEGFVK